MMVHLASEDDVEFQMMVAHFRKSVRLLIVEYGK